MGAPLQFILMIMMCMKVHIESLVLKRLEIWITMINMSKSVVLALVLMLSGLVASCQSGSKNCRSDYDVVAIYGKQTKIVYYIPVIAILSVTVVDDSAFVETEFGCFTFPAYIGREMLYYGEDHDIYAYQIWGKVIDGKIIYKIESYY